MSEDIKKAKKPSRAAAIPYGHDEETEALMFLVVTTNDRKRHWTFPKGQFDRRRDATWADTAQREAREEGGVEGAIDPKPLVEYPFPRKRGGHRRVVAFLLDVTQAGLPREGDDAEREVKWCTTEAALETLSKKRKPGYRAEMEKVFLAAKSALSEDD